MPSEELRLLLTPGKRLISKENPEQSWVFKRFQYNQAVIERTGDGMKFQIGLDELSEFDIV